MSASNNWLTVNRAGLRQILGDRAPAFALSELVQNAWDENVTCVSVSIEKPAGKKTATIRVVDDSPDGFQDLTQSYELFAPSKKKSDARMRGRFNLGEKLVLALCHSASITSTRGSIQFDETGRHRSRKRRASGTCFEAVITMSREACDACVRHVHRLIPPEGVQTFINGYEIQQRRELTSGAAALQTVISDDDGLLKRATRKTRITVYPATGDVGGFIYEMGIPVVEVDGGYDVNVDQRVPLNLQRDNVPPGYLRALNAEVLNLMSSEMNHVGFNESWARDAMRDHRTSSEAVGNSIRARFGDKVVSFDPSDPEANNKAAADGYTVIHGTQMSKNEWGKTRKAGLVRPAGQVTPSRRPHFSPDGDLVDVVRPEKYTEGMAAIAAFTTRVGSLLVGIPIRVEVVRLRQNFSAYYGARTVSYNLNSLGWRWFEHGITASVMDLLIHELGHEVEGNHLSEHYYRALTHLGSKMTKLALDEPELFDNQTYTCAAQDTAGALRITAR